MKLEQGILAPDKVIYVNRGGKDRIDEMMIKFKDDSWTVIDAGIVYRCVIFYV
jgi:hypothetical protein